LTPPCVGAGPCWNKQAWLDDYICTIVKLEYGASDLSNKVSVLNPVWAGTLSVQKKL